MSILSLHNASFESRSFFLRINNWFSLRIAKDTLGDEDGNKAWDLFETLNRDIGLFYNSLQKNSKKKMLNYDDSIREYRDLVARDGPSLSLEDIEITIPFWIKISKEFDEDVCEKLWPGEKPCHWTHIWDKWIRSKKRASDFSFCLDDANFETLIEWYEKKTNKRKRKRSEY